MQRPHFGKYYHTTDRFFLNSKSDQVGLGTVRISSSTLEKLISVTAGMNFLFMEPMAKHPL